LFIFWYFKKAFTNSAKEESKSENVLYELTFKAGYLLADKFETNENYDALEDRELIIVLNEISRDIIGYILSTRPQKIITHDNLFTSHYQLKTNTVLQMKDAQISFKTV